MNDSTRTGASGRPTTHACEVSVVIPTRNRQDLLCRTALRAALAQEDVDHEVIVVVDGSEDDTATRLGSLEEPRLRIVVHEERSGVARARNSGIAAARGAWIAFLDDDDVWSPRKLRHQLDAAETANAGAVYAGVVALDDRRRPTYSFPLPDPADLRRRILAASVLPAGCSNVVVRADLVRSLGGFDEELFQLCDWDLWVRLAWADTAAAVVDVLVGYVEHDGNMLLSDPRDVRAELDYLERKHRCLRKQCGVVLDRTAFAHWVAWGQLRKRRRLDAARTYFRSGIANRRGRDLALAGAFAARSIVPLGGVRRVLRSTSTHDLVPEPDWLWLYE